MATDIQEWTPPEVGKLYKPNPTMFKHYGGLEFDVVDSEGHVVGGHECKLDDIFLCTNMSKKKYNRARTSSAWPGGLFLAGDKWILIDKSELDLVVEATRP